jgi:hypothetical protein
MFYVSHPLIQLRFFHGITVIIIIIIIIIIINHWKYIYLTFLTY